MNARQAGDQEAVGRLWNRYFHRMAGLARLRLGRALRGAADEDDDPLHSHGCLRAPGVRVQVALPVGIAAAEAGTLADFLTALPCAYTSSRRLAR